eukprot:m.37821 g.37821  ORF g.37821 m.37821 type:complete len:50 (+) comp5468_c0_seq1:143-292(+)
MRLRTLLAHVACRPVTLSVDSHRPQARLPAFDNNSEAFARFSYVAAQPV